MTAMDTFGGIEEAMHVFRVLLLVAVGAAAVMLIAAPSVAQTGDAARVRAPKSYPIDPITGYPIPPGRKLVSNRVPAKVTVTRRSYLDPGTVSRGPLTEHYHDYAFPPDSASSIFYDPTDWRVNFHNRTPFPNCFDLPGFCK
jgi:hypothetical protein